MLHSQMSLFFIVILYTFLLLNILKDREQQFIEIGVMIKVPCPLSAGPRFDFGE